MRPYFLHNLLIGGVLLATVSFAGDKETYTVTLSIGTSPVDSYAITQEMEATYDPDNKTKLTLTLRGRHNIWTFREQLNEYKQEHEHEMALPARDNLLTQLTVLLAKNPNREEVTLKIESRWLPDAIGHIKNRENPITVPGQYGSHEVYMPARVEHDKMTLFHNMESGVTDPALVVFNPHLRGTQSPVKPSTSVPHTATALALVKDIRGYTPPNRGDQRLIPLGDADGYGLYVAYYLGSTAHGNAVVALVVDMDELMDNDIKGTVWTYEVDGFKLGAMPDTQRGREKILEENRSGVSGGGSFLNVLDLFGGGVGVSTDETAPPLDYNRDRIKGAKFHQFSFNGETGPLTTIIEQLNIRHLLEGPDCGPYLALASAPKPPPPLPTKPR